MWSLALGGCLLSLNVAATAQSAALRTDQKPNAGSAPPANRRVHAVHPHPRRHQNAQVLETATPPPTAQIPPVQQAAHLATVIFSDDFLRIDADNSSLVQVLQQVSHVTGMKIDGLSADKRIYGQYGPGSVTSTVSKLLNGAGYDYVIVGGGSGKPPAKLLLTAAGSMPAATPNVAIPKPAPDVQADASQAPYPVEPPHAKTPTEIFNELRRMHEMQSR